MRYPKFLILASVLSPTLWANTLPADVSVTVFTTQSYSMQHVDLANRIYYLDAVENLEESTSNLFSEEPRAAETQAKKWLQSAEGKQFEQKLQQAYVGVTEGWKLGVMKVPAVVFQKTGRDPVVVYGQTNIAQAINTYINSGE